MQLKFLKSEFYKEDANLETFQLWFPETKHVGLDWSQLTWDNKRNTSTDIVVILR